MQDPCVLFASGFLPVLAGARDTMPVGLRTADRQPPAACSSGRHARREGYTIAGATVLKPEPRMCIRPNYMPDPAVLFAPGA